MFRRLVIVGFVALAVRAAYAGQVQAATELTSILAALLEQRANFVPPLLVQKEPLPILPSEHWRSPLFQRMPQELKDALAHGAKAPIGAWDQAMWPATAELVPKQTIDASVRSRKDWGRFLKRFGVSGCSNAFSVPLITDDRLDALVYYEHSCFAGGLAEYVWLSRTSVSSSWQMQGWSTARVDG